MEITVKRIYFKEDYTIGALQVQNRETGKMEYMMDTLEPRAINWQKEKKVAGKTAIPEGRYRVEIAMSKTFKRKMPYLMDVPQFTGIMLHTGNAVKNTRGCILVGRNTVKGGLTDSRICFQQLYKLIAEAVADGEEVWVTVRSARGWRAV